VKVKFAIHTLGSTDGVLWVKAQVCLGRKLKFYILEIHDVAVLEDNGLKEFVEEEIPKPTTTDAQNMDEWKKCVAKTRRVILEGFETTLSRVSMGKKLLMLCGKH